MNRALRAYGTGLFSNAICALAFWVVWGLASSPSVVSFWNRPVGVIVVLTLLFILLGARVQIWYARKLEAYALERSRGPIRILPLAFGLAVFGCVVTWLAVTLSAESVFRGYKLLFDSAGLDRTVFFLPFVFFFQFLFSQSTIIWLLAAGVVWPLAARTEPLRTWFVHYRQDPEGRARLDTPLGFVKAWNLLGYLLFILALLLQS